MGLEMSQPGLDHSALVEEVKETTALVILALGSMMHISEEQARLLARQSTLLHVCLPYRWLVLLLPGVLFSCQAGGEPDVWIVRAPQARLHRATCWPPFLTLDVLLLAFFLFSFLIQIHA